MARIEALPLLDGLLDDSARFLRRNTSVGTRSYSFHSVGGSWTP